MEASEQRLFPRGHLDYLTFDRGLYPWRYALCTAMGTPRPEALRWTAQADDHHAALQATPWHQLYYAHFDFAVRPLYRAFLRHLAAQWGRKPGELIYQRTPTLRIQFPDSLAVGEWHRDSDYGHADGEINVWLPVTEARETSALWVGRDCGDTCWPCNYGETILFDGVNLLHGNKPNQTGKTRVSIDFRVALAATYTPSRERSASAGVRMDVGPCYFERLTDGMPKTGAGHGC